MTEFEVNYSTMSDKELEQYNELNLQALKHYETLAEDKEIPEANRFEIDICIREIKKDIEAVKLEIQLRHKKK
jgi:hypothetical protein